MPFHRRSQPARDEPRRAHDPPIRYWCMQHGAPFQVLRLLPEATRRLAELAREHPRVLERAAAFTPPNATTGPREVDLAIRDLSPACCLLTDEERADLLLQLQDPASHARNEAPITTRIGGP